MNKNTFAIGDNVYVVLNRFATFGLDNTWGGIPQPPDEMFVAPGVVYESTSANPENGMVAVSVDLSAEDKNEWFEDYNIVLNSTNVFHSEEEAKKAAQDYNKSHRKDNMYGNKGS